jgi:hypothetical protein
MERSAVNWLRQRPILLMLGGILTMLGVILLLLKACTPEVVIQGVTETLLTPRDLARRLDRDAILAYSRTEVRSVTYDGILRGAYGALWGGEANNWDRALLAATALEAEGLEVMLVPDDTTRISFRDKATSSKQWTTVRLDADLPAESSDAAPTGAISLQTLYSDKNQPFYNIFPAIVLEDNDGKVRRIEPQSPQLASEWVHLPVILSVVDGDGGPHYILNVGDRLLLDSGSVADVKRASLELSLRFGTQTNTWTRELFDRINAAPETPGHPEPLAGDKYAVVVAAGPIITDVLHTREVMLSSTDYTPISDTVASDLVQMGTNYFVASDDHSVRLAEKLGVEISWTSPRIIVAASLVQQSSSLSWAFVKERLHNQAALSLDVLQDVVDAKGADSKEFQTSRGLATDMIETRIVYEAVQMPVVSASTIFSRYVAAVPDSAYQRISTLEAEAKRMIDEEPIGTREYLKILPPLALITSTANMTDVLATAQAPLWMERTSDGLFLHGTSKDTSIQGQDEWEQYVVDQDGVVPVGKDTRTLALISEAVLGRRVAQRSDYLLAFSIERPLAFTSLPVTSGSALIYSVKQGTKVFHMAVLVIQFGWRIGRRLGGSRVWQACCREGGLARGRREGRYRSNNSVVPGSYRSIN